MHLSFLGAAGTVTGSQYLLETAQRRILIDCGLFQGYKQLRLRNWAKLAYDPRDLDAIVLTHAHLDHSGLLPRLVSRGFSGPVFCTRGTRDLCGILLPDSARLQEEDASFANRHGFSKHKPPLPLYTSGDAEACLKLLRAVEFNEPASIHDDVRVTFFPAGHLLGAAFVRVETQEGSVTFSGDLGRPDDPIMNPPHDRVDADHLVIESTYGDSVHPTIYPEQELESWLAPACARGAVVVIPAFAVGRTQALLLLIARLKAGGKIPDVPVFMDSPMAIDATRIYQHLHAEHRLDDEDCARMHRTAQVVSASEGSKALDRRAGPMVILSASGMATGGRVLHHLKAFAGDERNLILLSGFQAGGTRGGALAAGAKSLRIHGQEVLVRAQVGQLHASSAHADTNELIAWMRSSSSPPRKVFVTHGEPGASDALRQRIEREQGWTVVVPEHGSVHDLSAADSP
ncbi:MAG: MBL fold metallo-hydrolase [Pseudomonadota bacterium]